MYWPIGGPKVYAATKARLPRPPSESDDGRSRRGTLSNIAVQQSGSVLEQSTEDADLDGAGAGRSEGSTADGGIAAVDEEGRTPTVIKVNPLEADEPETDLSGPVIGLRITRNGHMFATITRSTLTIWQTKPTAILASVIRSDHSLKTYGPNVAVLLRPDSAIFVIQTELGYLITYSIASDPASRVYKHEFAPNARGHTRQRSAGYHKSHALLEAKGAPNEGYGIREVSVRFRMVIRVDAGISRVLALDDELIVATKHPAAIQCIRWTPDSSGAQTSTELLSRMPWIGKRAQLVDLIYDRPMNLFTWITNEGKVFAVQRQAKDAEVSSPVSGISFNGYGFHSPEKEEDCAIKVAVNARFSLIAVGCSGGEIHVYIAKDYVGRVPLSHKLRANVSPSSSGRITFLAYSPDGHCLFAGFERGWQMWSVFGSSGSSSFSCDQQISRMTDDKWLLGVRDGAWIGGGSEILLVTEDDNRIWMLEMARSAISGNLISSNTSRSLLQTSTGLNLYRGYGVSDLTTISADASQWQNIQIPSQYLMDQWPMRMAVMSPDGRYIAVAGRRGLAHYSVNSGRWKVFDDAREENEFTVRGGMCWHQNTLIAAVDSDETHELRLYSREHALSTANIASSETLPAPIVLISTSGSDSLLVYSFDNVLYHYVIVSDDTSVRLVQTGQIALHGIIRAPARVRAVSWVLPEDQINDGDPSQDVVVATVLFLVDANLLLLQPTTSEEGELKYEMRVVAQNVEYYILVRDQNPSLTETPEFAATPHSGGEGLGSGSPSYATEGHGLRDSLWFFDGQAMKVWTDVQDLLTSAPADLGRELSEPVKIGVDFYPLSVLLGRGIVFGIESDLVQRKDMPFALFRFATRTQLFLPALYRFHLSHFDSAAALHLSHRYQRLSYFSHALEMLLHDVLDDEVDHPPANPDHALLPSVLSFLSSFPDYLDIVVQCTRKTELRSWRTLFACLPAPRDLFEESLQRGSLKTAAGYLLVLHTFEERNSASEELLRILRMAREEGDWELCKDLARFLAALDESGETLRGALEKAGLDEQNHHGKEAQSVIITGTVEENAEGTAAGTTTTAA